MHTILAVVAAWTTLDVALIATWHLAHVRSRRWGSRALAGEPSTQRVYTQRVYAMAPELRSRDARPTPMRTEASTGHFAA